MATNAHTKSGEPKPSAEPRAAQRGSARHLWPGLKSRLAGVWRNAPSSWMGVVAAIGVWELLTRAEILPSQYIPPMSVVLPELWRLLGESSFWSAVGQTLQGWAMGLGISAGAGIPLGLIIGSNPYLYRATRVTVEFLRPIPSVALIPLAILIFGISLDMKVFLVAFATFWPILIQSIYGVQDVDPVARDTARSFGVSRVARFFRVTLPSAAPYLATGLRIASALGMILVITGELVAGVPGLGRDIMLAQSGGTNDTMYALILTTGVLGYALSAGIGRLERYVLRWHQSYREVQQA